MAKKKASPKSVPPARPAGEFVSIISLKGSRAYQHWLSGLSRTTHIPAAAIVRLALADWTARNGHPDPPEK
jgi:hypothetical protein